MSIYSGTRTAQEFAHGVDDGRLWAEQDRDALATSYWLETFRAEAVNAIGRNGRAYYLGVMRGYRETVRTLRNGRWGT